MPAPKVTISDNSQLFKHQLISNHCRFSKKIEEAASGDVNREDEVLDLESGNDDTNEQDQITISSGEDAPRSRNAPPQQVPQPPEIPSEAPQLPAGPILPVEAPPV